MISELVVDVQPKEVSIAVLEDKSLVELQKEARNVSFAVGDIYLGKVKKLMPGLNAAFIDVGYKKDAIPKRRRYCRKLRFYRRSKRTGVLATC